MKKVLILCLALTLIICNFASCGNHSEENSAVSSSSEISETSEAPKIPENVLYYEGEYTVAGDADSLSVGSFMESKILSEAFSWRDGLNEYFKNNDVSGDTYFLVAVQFGGIKRFDEENRNVLIEYLGEFDFLPTTEQPFDLIFEYREKYGELLDQYDATSNKNERKNIDKKIYELKAEYLQKMLPDVDIGDIVDSELLFCNFYLTGYISASALREIAEDKDGCKIAVTWMPAPEDQERWLTFPYVEKKEIEYFD